MGCCESSSAAEVACVLSAISASERAHHHALTRELFGDVGCMKEITDGYAVRLRSSQFETLAEFVANERKCCAFLRFEITIEPASGPILLRMTGSQGTQDLLREALDASCRCSSNERRQV